MIDHAKYLMQSQPKNDEICINIIQILRQMVFHNYVPIYDKVVCNFYLLIQLAIFVFYFI